MVASIICVGCRGSHADQVTQTPVPATKNDDPDSSSGMAPIKLRRIAGVGYALSSKVRQPVFQNGGLLISIDGKNLSELKKAEIEKLLCGPIGSEVEITYITSDGGVETEKIQRTKIEKTSLWPRKQLAIANFDNRSDREWNEGFAMDSLDLEARASQGIAMRLASEALPQHRQTISIEAFAAAITDYQLGNLSGGDEKMDVCLKNFEAQKPWRANQNIQILRAINLLASLGRFDVCPKIVNMIAASKSSRDTFQWHEALGVVAMGQQQSAPSDALETVRKFQNIYSSADLPRWVSYIYATNGKLADANAVILKQLAPIESYFNTQPDPVTVTPGVVDMDTLRRYATCLYDLGCTQSYESEFTKAESTFQKGKDLFASKLSNAQMQSVQQQPELFPKPNDFANAISAVKARQKVSFPQPEILVLQPEADLVNKCHLAIQNADKSSAQNYMRTLLAGYKGNVPDPLESEFKLNVYCAILNLAREMCDKNWLLPSAEALENLRQYAEGKDANPIAAKFLATEIAYVAAKAKDPDENRKWTEFRGQKIGNFAFNEQLRQVAALYYYSGDTRRASFFIDKALGQLKADQGKTFDDPAAQECLLKLYAACIAANDNNFAAAEKFKSEIEQIPYVRSNAIQFTAIELASRYVKAGKRDKAIAFLKNVRNKDLEHSKRQNESGAIEIDIYLARLLLEAGLFKEANEIAAAAAEKNPGGLGWQQCYIVAKCAESAGDYARAAKYLEQRHHLGGSDTTSLVMFSSLRDILGDALKNAEKAPKGAIEPALFARIYSELADSLDSNNMEEKRDLYRKAVAVAPNDSQQKLQLMTHLANYEVYSQPRGKHTEVTTSGATNSGATQPDRNESGAEAGLRIKETVARLAEQKGEKNAAMLWAQLASTEFGLAMYDKTVEHMLHVIALYSVSTPYTGAMAHSEHIVAALKVKGRSADAENLLNKALEKTISVFGENSIQTQAQLIDSFRFYAESKREQLALNYLERALRCNMKTGEAVSQSLSRSHCGAGPRRLGDAVEVVGAIISVAQEVEKYNPKFAEQILKKTLSAQRSALGTGDERLLATLSALVGFMYRQGDYHQAETYGNEAYAISSKSFTGEFAVRMAGKEYVYALRQLGKIEKANELASKRWEGVRQPARR